MPSAATAPTVATWGEKFANPPALQYNFVFDRAGGLAQLNNPNWPQWVSTIIPPKEGELANGTYRPLLTPVNFEQSKPGTKYFTAWYAGPLSINNHRGQLEFIPSKQSRSRKSAQGDKWSFCLTAGTLWPANQERP